MSEIEPVEGRVCRFLMREVNMLYECASTDHMPSIACVSCAEGSYGEMGSMLGSCVYRARWGRTYVY